MLLHSPVLVVHRQWPDFNHRVFNLCILCLYRIVADPDQDSFVPLSDSTTDLNLASGSDSLEFNVTFTIRNIGPSDSPFSTITIYWPLTDPAKTDQFFLYPLSIRTVSYIIMVMNVWIHACYVIYTGGFKYHLWYGAY